MHIAPRALQISKLIYEIFFNIEKKMVTPLYTPPMIYTETMCPFVFSTPVKLESVEMVINGTPIKPFLLDYEHTVSAGCTMKKVNAYLQDILLENKSLNTVVKLTPGCFMSLRFLQDKENVTSTKDMRMKELNRLEEDLYTEHGYDISEMNMFLFYIPKALRKRCDKSKKDISFSFIFADGSVVKLDHLLLQYSTGNYRRTIRAILSSWGNQDSIRAILHEDTVQRTSEIEHWQEEGNRVVIWYNSILTHGVTAIAYSNNVAVTFGPPVIVPVTNKRAIISFQFNCPPTVPYFHYFMQLTYGNESHTIFTSVFKRMNDTVDTLDLFAPLDELIESIHKDGLEL